MGTGYEANSQLSFNLAIHKALQVNKLIGGRIIYLECKDVPKLRNFYEGVGLELYVDDNGNPILSDTGLLTYLISTKNISISKKSVSMRNRITLE